MSPKFNKVKAYYDSGRWNKEMVGNAVVKGWITAAEYELIVGEPYEG
ncbi:MAG: XkdX family protein [Kiritimatiellae bacterium]|nr:XkdX family protein [Kiritimatiellia bacterium]